MPKQDFSRTARDPRKNYAGVRRQPGRVSLDSDWNSDPNLSPPRRRPRRKGPSTRPRERTDAYVTSQTLKAKTVEWLAAIAGVNTHQMHVRAGKSALLVIDMRRFFADPAGPAYLPCTRAILPSIRRLVEAFRAARRPVIYTRHVHHPELLDAGIMAWWWQEMCVEGSLDSEVMPEIAPRESDKVVTKHRYSAFFDTDLETILRTLKIEDLVICGVMTNMCCESTARDAYYRDYWTFFPADATGAPTEAMHQASLLNLAYGFARVATTDEIIRQLALTREDSPGSVAVHRRLS